jgi:hypothetical protein
MRPVGTAELDELFARPHDPVEYPGPRGAIVPAGLRLRPLCHGEADFRVVYERPGGYLVLACNRCGTILCRVAVGRL